MVKLRTEKGLDTYELVRTIFCRKFIFSYHQSLLQESNDKDDKLSGSAGQSVCKCDSVAKEMADLRNLILQSQQALHIQIAEATQQVQTAIKSLRHDRN